MAGIDKMNEFYMNAARFGFLASAYRPEGLPEDINQAMDVLVNYFNNDIYFKTKADEASEWFDKMCDEIAMHKRKDLLGQLIKECSR